MPAAGERSSRTRSVRPGPPTRATMRRGRSSIQPCLWTLRAYGLQREVVWVPLFPVERKRRHLTREQWRPCNVCGLNFSTTDADTSNPHFEVRTADGAKAQVCFSKVYNAPPNPTKGYCAIMTCSQADEACPLVKGCDLRMPIRYEDPKIADGTDQETNLYDERSRQICREMLFMMSNVQP